MARHQIDADQAFAVLVRYSRDTNTKLVDVARTVIEHRRALAEDRRGSGRAGQG